MKIQYTNNSNIQAVNKYTEVNKNNNINEATKGKKYDVVNIKSTGKVGVNKEVKLDAISDKIISRLNKETSTEKLTELKDAVATGRYEFEGSSIVLKILIRP